MTTWALLAPGPSASVELAERLRGLSLGVVGNAFELAPWADFLAATDSSWWRKHPEAHKFSGERFSMLETKYAKQIRIPYFGQVCNSGVLGLEVAKRKGATKILLCGFDMHGSHFFGQYTNGLRNTAPQQRAQHHKQYLAWKRSNPTIQVFNCTEGSALKCFPMARLESELEAGISKPSAY
jgi:hypothetical protein